MSLVLYRKEGHVAYITLNNPESLNAINRKMAKELIEVWIDYRDDDNLWVAILNGEGKSFCSGADVKEMERGAWKFRQSLVYGDDRIGHTNYNLWKPIIAAVHRHTYGGGLLLALESDIIVASEDALFGLPEGKVNIPTLVAPFLTDFMPRTVANELMYTAKPLHAKRAYELGIINRVVEKENLMSTAQEFAEQICKNGPMAAWAAKEMMWRTRGMSTADAITVVEHIATPVWNSEDSKEAKQAFKEKRMPQWKLK